jgi:hypothetical protein
MLAAVFRCPLLLSLIDNTKVQRSVSHSKDIISGLLIFYLGGKRAKCTYKIVFFTIKSLLKDIKLVKKIDLLKFFLKNKMFFL